MEYPERHVADLDAIGDPGAIEFHGSDPEWPFRGVVVHWNGAVHAYENSCPHAGHALNLLSDRFFDANENLLICSSHGALFEPASGFCVGGPCPGKTLMSLPCRVVNNKIYVRAPDTVKMRKPT